MKRVDKLMDVLKEQELDGLFIVKDANIRYLSGFTGSESYMVISQECRAFITDSRYTEQAERECRDFEIIKWRSPNPDLPETIKSVCSKYNIKRLGFEKNCVKVDLYERLKEALGDIEFTGTLGLVEGIRRIKDQSEIECIKKAAQISDDAFNEILNYIRPGVSERDIERELSYLIRKKGADDIGFPIIAASGGNSSMPHAVPSDKLVECGEFITMDFGSLYKGYRSDMTRTIVVGSASEKQRYIYNVVKESLRKSTETVKAGVDCKIPDRAAREVILKEGIKEIFEYGVGHGVGLEIHEDPFMSPKCPLILEAGNVVTVEPGIYIPGWGGVRIEDSVVVTQDGCEIITKSPKELIVV